MCHLKYSLGLLILNKKRGYTALMGVPPKVQPTYLLILNKALGYTALMGVPPKVQPRFADLNHTRNKALPVNTAFVSVPHRVQ